MFHVFVIILSFSLSPRLFCATFLYAFFKTNKRFNEEKTRELSFRIHFFPWLNENVKNRTNTKTVFGLDVQGYKRSIIAKCSSQKQFFSRASISFHNATVLHIRLWQMNILPVLPSRTIILKYFEKYNINFIPEITTRWNSKKSAKCFSKKSISA